MGASRNRGTQSGEAKFRHLSGGVDGEEALIKASSFVGPSSPSGRPSASAREQIGAEVVSDRTRSHHIQPPIDGRLEIPSLSPPGPRFGVGSGSGRGLPERAPVDDATASPGLTVSHHSPSQRPVSGLRPDHTGADGHGHVAVDLPMSVRRPATAGSRAEAKSTTKMEK